MKCSTMQMGHHAVIAVKEPVNHMNCKELESYVLAEIGKNHLTVILELKEVSYLDSAALETLLALQETIKEQGSQLKLAALNELCRDIMIVTRLINQFHVYSSVPEAIKEPT